MPPTKSKELKLTGEGHFQAITREEWKQIQAVALDMPASRALAQKMGDRLLQYGFAPWLQRDVIFRLVSAVMVDEDGRKLSDYIAVPWPLKICEDPITRVPWTGPEDPRVVAWLQANDTHRMSAKDRYNHVFAEHIENEKKAAAILDEQTDILWSLRDQFAKLADESGVVEHRKGGHEGGKISTAALWTDHNAPTRKKQVSGGKLAKD